MEIKVNIPSNDYVQPTEIRQDVVQRICDIILENYLDSGNRVSFTDEKAALFIGTRTISSWEFEGFTRIRGCEMNAAFQALIQAFRRQCDRHPQMKSMYAIPLYLANGILQDKCLGS